MKKRTVFFALLMLSGCVFDPFVDTRGEVSEMYPKLSEEKIGRSTRDNPVVCYNKWFTDAGEIAALAEQECLKSKRRAHLVTQNAFACRLFVPTQAVFECR